jgi:hypothetical protein
MRDHPDGETIAAFREDQLPGRKAARIAAHLAECPRCAEVDAQLAAVTAALARTPAPPIPASLAARLDAALAAEIAARSAAGASAGHADSAEHAAPTGSAERAAPAGHPAPAGHTGSPAARAHRGPGTGPGHTGPGHSGPGPGGPGRRGRPRAGSRLSLRIAAVAAAVVVLAGGGYAVARVVAGGQETSSSGSSSAASGSAASPSSGAALAPEAVPRAPSAGLPLVHSGTTYRAGQLPAQVAAVLKRYPAQGHPGAAPPVAAGTRSAAFPHLDECVSHVAGGQRPRLVDIARYGTQPAAVIVVPVPGTTTVRVSVVGPGCSVQGGDIIHQFSMPAPG